MEEEQACSVEEERKRGSQASVHNEQDKLRGIQKRSRTGRRVVCVYIQGGWRGSLRRRGGAREIERAPEAVGRERGCYSDFTRLQAPIPLTFYSSLQSPISSMRARHALPLCAYCLPPVPLCTMLNWGTAIPTILNKWV